MAEGKVGFVGLGIMGKPMAKNLIKAGHKLVVYSGSSKADELTEEGAGTADTYKAIAEQCDVVITCLPASAEVEKVYRGEEGLLAGANDGNILIDMSTISPLVTKELAREAGEKGVKMLDAPISGGEPGAISGDLALMVGGAEEDFDRARPLFEPLGTATHVGAAGSGQIVKACNQVIVGIVIEGVSEALVLGSKAGVDPAKIIEAVSGGLAGTKVMDQKRDKMLGHDFEPGFRAELHHKDLGIALATAREVGVPLPVTAFVDQMLQELQVKNRGGLDHSALLTAIEDAAQHKIGEATEALS
ncbi:MAG TPA: 2-hydroxy-3-oxopropionate reductase [Acidimicrobiales bacterium]|nr:2-hydroxy-3-oxopropionate reductase [Acidimicrobiales bacterium]